MSARACPACLARSASGIGAVNGFDLLRCRRCGTLFTAALPAGAEDAKDYTDYYHDANLEIPEFVEDRLDSVAAGFEPYRRSGRWLDVGCGAGALMRAAAGRGWSVLGTEVAPGAAEAVRSQGFDVELGTLEELELDEDSFDVVSLVEVVEHVEDPGALIARSASLVRPGGALYLTTPHGRGISARMLGTRWSAVAPPEHLQLLSVRGVRGLLGRAGLAPRSIHAHAVNPYELVSGLRRGRAETSADERMETGYRLNESLSSRRAGSAAKSALNGLLSLARLGDGLKVTAERPG